MNIDQKYKALLGEAQKRNLPDVEGIQLCFMTLSLAPRIDRDYANQLSVHGLSARDSNPLLDGLEREGLIERQADTEDRRALRFNSLQKES